MKKRIGFSLCMCVMLWLLAAGCSGQGAQGADTENPQESGTGFVVPGPGSYDSADTAVITRINSAESTITFLNLTVDKRYTLTYDGATSITDKYGQGMSMAQVREGDIVDVKFLRGKKLLSSMQISSAGFCNSEISRFEINTLRNDMAIGGDIYKISDDTVVFSEGREIELRDINASDILTVSGIESNIYSIVVEKGHGYLKLNNDEKFIGGFIEVGQSQITEIKEDMLLIVPEGSYQVQISYKGGGGTKSVVVNRDEEVTLDIGDLTIPEPKYGRVLFTLSPVNLSLYIDGEEVDASGGIELSYGIHRLYARADGYGTVTSYLKVNQELTAIDVVLEPFEKEEDEAEENENTGEDGKEDLSGNEIKNYQVHVDAPEGAEVYLNGNYIGIAPVSFAKTPGTHVITLRKSGYETRSYTVQIDNEAKDVNYVFTELEKTDSKEPEKEETQE